MSRVTRWLVLALYVVNLVAGLPGMAAASSQESIVYQDGGSSFYRINPDGSGPLSLLKSLPVTPQSTTVKPDGSGLLSFASVTGLYSSSTSGLSALNLAPAGYNVGSGMAYSPDGAKIAFVARTGSASFYSVYVMNADGTGVTAVVPPSARHQMVLGWGPAGVLYKDWDGTNLTFPLWQVNPTTLVKSRLSPANFSAISASLSPGGSKIALVASERVGSTIGANALYVLAGGPIQKITTTPSITPNAVAWAPTGDRVALSGYAAGDSGKYKVFRVDLNLAANSGVATPVATATGNNTVSSVFWGDLQDPLTPTNISTVDLSGQYGETVTLRATLTTSAGTALPGKSVTFKVNGTPIGNSSTDASGVATLPWPINLSPGTYPITAAFTGDAIYNAATTAPTNNKSLTVSKAVTTLTLPTKTLVAGDPLTLSGSLSALATGLGAKAVALKVDGALVTTVTTDGAGNFTYTYTPALAAGTYTAQADFAGDTNYTSATASFSLVVTKAPTTLKVNPQTITYGDPLVLTAKLTRTSDGAPLSGKSISLKVNGQTVTGTTDGSGQVSISYGFPLGAGTYTIDGTFTADASYQGATDQATLTVNKQATSLALTPATQTVPWGGTPALSATLTAGSPAAGVAGKSIIFKTGTTTLCTVTTDASGVATCNPTGLFGTNTITASFGGDANLVGSSATATVDVTKANTTLVVSPIAPVTYPANPVITVTLTENVNNTGLSGKTVTILINGQTVTGTTNASGVATITYSGPVINAGTYPAKASFAGDSNFNASSDNSKSAVVNQATTTLTLTPATQTITYGQSNTLTATLTAGTSPIAGQTVTFKDQTNALLCTGSTDAAGKVTCSPNLPGGTYTITADFAGTTNYVASSATASLTVNKANTTLTVPAQTVAAGGTVTVTAKLTAGSTNLAGRTVLFKVDGAQVGTSQTTDANGNASVTYTAPVSGGTHTITVDFAGDGYYNASTGTNNLTVTAPATTLTISPSTTPFGTNPSLTAHLKENVTSTGVAGKLITFTVNGQTVSGTTDSNGDVTVTYTYPLSGGSYPINATWAGDAAFLTSSGSNTLTVNKLATSLALTPATQTVTWGQAVTVTATLTAGAPVAGKSIVFKQGATTLCTVTTDASGVANCSPTGLMGNGLTITATFAGDADYISSSATATVTVNKAGTTLVVSPITPVSYPSNPVITVTLKENVNNTGLNGKTVTVVINGQTQTGTTNASGVATITYAGPVLNAGTYPVNASFGGDTNFNASSDTTQSAVVNPAATAMTLTPATQTITYGQSNTLTATLTVGGTPLAGQTVTFKDQTNALLCTGTTDAAGKATCSPDLPAGNYTITANAASTTNYAGSNATATLTVNKANTTLTVPAKTVAAGGTVTLTANLAAGSAKVAGRTVVFKLDGTQVGTPQVTDANGDASVSYTAPVAGGTHTITVDFAGDGYYNAATGTNTLTVTAPATTLTVSPSTTTFGTNPTLTAHLKENVSNTGVAGKLITFTVNGQTVSGTTDSNGDVTVTYTYPLGGGSYPISATWAGDASFLTSTGSNTLTVNKLATSLALTPATQTVSWGQAVTLTATLTAGAPVAGKSIVFKQGATTLCTVTTDASGVANCNPTGLFGANTITATFAGDADYVNSSATATVNVNKAATTLAVSPIAPVTYPANPVITVTLTENVNNTGLNGKTVTVVINGQTQTGTTNASGVATITYSGPVLAAGSYPVNASFAGDTNFNASSDNTKSAVVNAATTAMTLTPATQTITYGQSNTLTATLAVGGSPLAGQTVTFKDQTNALLCTGTTDAAGKATCSPDLPSGTYTITAAFAGTTNYVASSATATLTVNKANTTVTVPAKTVPAGGTVTLTANLAAGTTKIQGRTVTFTVGSTVLGTKVTDANGDASFDYTPPLGGATYTIKVDFAGDGYYNASTGTNTLTVTQPATTLTVSPSTTTFGTNPTLTAHLKENVGNTGISGRTITFTVNGQTVSGTTDSNGDVTVTYTYPIGGGSYPINATFVDDGIYLGSTGSNTLTVNKLASSLALTPATQTVTWGQTVTLTATLTAGAPVAGKSIVFKQGATTLCTVTTDASGVANCSPTGLMGNGLTITATFAGDADYLASSATATVNVNKANTTLVVSPVAAVTYPANPVITVTLKENVNNTGLNGKTVTVVINGQTQTGTTNASGVATITYAGPALSAGTYPVNASFAGDTNFNASSDTTQSAVVNPAATAMTLTPATQTITYGQSNTLTATLTVGGSPLTGQTVTFKDQTNALLCTGTTDASGKATCSPNLPGGNYTITAAFAGTTNYLASSTTATLTVNKANTTVTVPAKTVAAGGTVTLTANLAAGSTKVAGRTVVFKLNGTQVGTPQVTDANGDASVSYTAPVAGGTQTITVDFAGDGYYNAATGTNTLTVTAPATTLTVSPSTTTFGTNPSLTAHLKESVGNTGVAGKLITFTVNGQTVSGTTDSNGDVTVTYTYPLGAGTYTINAAWAGDSAFLASNGSNTLTVNKQATSLALTPATQTVTWGQTVTVTATLTGGAPVAGKSIVFKQGATTLCTVTTDASGVANCSPVGLMGNGLTITATFAGDADYLASSATATVNVNKANTTLVVSPVAPVTYPANPVITVTLKENVNNTGLNGKTVTVVINGQTQTGTTNASGVATITYAGPVLNAGTYPVNASFAGDTNFNASSDTTQSAVVNPAATAMTLTPATQTITYGQSNTLTATLTVGGSPVTGQTVTFTDQTNAVLCTVTTDAAGKATCTPDLPSGNYTIKAAFAGTTNYAAASATATLTVNKATTTLTVPAQSVGSGGTVTLTATLTAGSTKLAGRTVTFTIDGNTLTGTTDSNGVASVSYTPPFGAATYPFTADFAGDSFYTAATGNNTLTVTQMASKLISVAVSAPYGTQPTLKAHLQEQVSGLGIAGRTIVFTVSGKTVTGVTDSNGDVSVSYPFVLPGGTYQIRAAFIDDGIYLGSTDNSKNLTVTPAVTALSLTPATQTVAWGQTVTLTATLTAGSPAAGVNGKSIVFKQGATTLCTVTTNASGVATCSPVGLMGSGLTITATFAGDTDYATSSATATVTVNKADTTLVVSPITSVNYPNNPVISVTLTENVGNTGLNGKTVTITINGQTYSPTTNASGVATVTYSGPALNAGTYPVTASFAGDANYNASSDNSKSAVVNQNATSMTLTPATQTVTYGQTVTLTATLTPNVAGKSIVFKQGATTLCTVPTDAAGKAVCNPTGMIGSGLNVTANWAGDTNYGPSSASATVTVNPANTTLTVSPIAPVTYPSNPVITVTLKENVNNTGLNGKSVTITINGQTYAPTTNASGVATVTYSGPTLNAGTYPVTATFTADATYNGSSDNTQSAVVNQVTTSMSLTPATQTVTWGQTVTLTATLTPNVAGKTITFTQGATTLCTVNTDAAGKAVCDATGKLMGSNLSVTASFAGDTNYTASSANATVTVNKANTQLVVSPITPVTYPSNPVITVTLTETVGNTGLNGKTVTITINGQTYTPTTNASGVATVTYSGPVLPVGSYPVTATFAADANYNGSSDNSKSAVVNQLATSMTLTPATQTVTWGQTVTLTATLTPNVAGKAIVFTQGATTLCTVNTDAAGKAVCDATGKLMGNNLTVTASWAGDTNYGPSSATATVTVNKAGTTLVVSPITPVTYPGNPVITVTLTENVGNTGLNGKTVTITINGQTYSPTTNASGVATVTYSGPTLNAGTYPVTATFAADANYNGSSDNSKSAVVNQVATSMTLTPATQTVTWGQTVTLTATLTPNVAGKAIVFTQGGTTLCTVNTDAAGKAVCDATGKLMGNNLTVTASWAGDTNYGPSSATATVTVNKAGTTLVVSPITPVTYPGNPVITVTLTENVGNTGLNGKTVTITINGQTYSPTTNASGVATVTYSGPTLNVGSYPVTASFAGDANYTASSDNTKSAVVNQVATSMTLTPATQTVTWGQTVTLTATLTPNVAGKPIVFMQGATTLCTINSDAAGKAVCDATGKLMGSNLTVTASFAGDTNYGASSASATVTVNQAGTKLVVSPIAPVTYPSNPVIAVTLTETVGNTGLNGKTVTITINGQTYTPTTNASGVATVTYSGPTLNAGTYPVTASFAGDANYSASSDNSKSALVNKITTSMTLTPATQTVTWGQNVTLTATLTPAVAGKSIVFTQGATTLCTINSDAAGKAVCDATGKLMGNNLTVTATFAGDTNYAGSAANATVTVNKANTTLVVSPIAAVTYPSNPVITVTLKENVFNTGLNGKTVTVVINGQTLTGVTNASGVATITYSGPTLNAGTYPVTATFAADANYNGSSDNTQSAVVNRASCTMTLTITPNPVNVGNNVTATATLSAGTYRSITLWVSGMNYATMTSGTPQTINAWTRGTFSVYATVAQDTNYLACTSPTINVVVQ